jgi:hypothetical protein
MRQQINLYQPIFSEERKLFGARTAATGFAILLAALGLFHLRQRAHRRARQERGHAARTAGAAAEHAGKHRADADRAFQAWRDRHAHRAAFCRHRRTRSGVADSAGRRRGADDRLRAATGSPGPATRRRTVDRQRAALGHRRLDEPERRHAQPRHHPRLPGQPRARCRAHRHALRRIRDRAADGQPSSATQPAMAKRKRPLPAKSASARAARRSAARVRRPPHEAASCN